MAGNRFAVFDTLRLYARPFVPDEDAEEAFLIYGDPEVTHFINLGQADESVTVTAIRLARYAAVEGGRGLMALIDKENGSMVGSILIKRLPDNERRLTSDWEVGWHLRRTVWGSGFATEAGAAALDYGFNKLKLTEIFAVVDPGNYASQKVVQRLQMAHLGLTNKYYAQSLELYRALPVGK